MTGLVLSFSNPGSALLSFPSCLFALQHNPKGSGHFTKDAQAFPALKSWLFIAEVETRKPRPQAFVHYLKIAEQGVFLEF